MEQEGVNYRAPICYHLPTMAAEFERTGDIHDLIRMVDTLLGEGGCPWDREQTIEDFIKFITNESQEVIDAIKAGDWDNTCEEVGDLMFLCVFLCRIAEKEGKFTLKQTVQKLIEKMIRRHPHVFSDTKVSGPAEVLENWQEIKKREKGADNGQR